MQQVDGKLVRIVKASRGDASCGTPWLGGERVRWTYRVARQGCRAFIRGCVFSAFVDEGKCHESTHILNLPFPNDRRKFSSLLSRRSILPATPRFRHHCMSDNSKGRDPGCLSMKSDKKSTRSKIYCRCSRFITSHPSHDFHRKNSWILWQPFHETEFTLYS